MYTHPRDMAAVFQGLPFTLSLAHALQSATRFASGLVLTVITPLDGPVSLQRVYGPGSNLVAKH